MKNSALFFCFIMIALHGVLIAQVPQSFQYQAVVRDGNGDVVINQPVSFQISIFAGSATGTLMYSETHSITTNSFGLVVFAVGTGSPVSGDFVTINWGADLHFLKVEADITGGTTYVDMGTTQLLSVPYALHSKTSEDAFSGNYLDLTNTPDFTGWDQNASNDFSGNYNDLTGVPTNVSAFNNDAGYITSPNDADADASNELQILSISGNDLTISDGNTVALPQTTYIAGTGIDITSGTITNTIPDQTVTISGSGATTVTGAYPNFNVSSTDNNTTYSAGSGLSLTGTTFENTSPDQVVTIAGSGATTVSGTYPSFTVSSTDNNTTYSAGTGLSLTGTTFENTAPDQAVSLTQGGATTITGTYPNFTISSTDNNTTYTAGTGMSLSGTQFNCTQTLAQTLANGNSAGTTSINMNSQNITNANILGLRSSNAAYIDMYYGHIYDYAGSHGISGQVLTVRGTSPNTYVRWESPSSFLTAGTGLSYSGSTLNSVWSVNGTHIYNNNTGNVGVGLNTPNARLTVFGNSSNTPQEPLFEVKNRAGQTVFIVYEDSVRVYVDDDPAKSNKGAFAVSGRNTSKAITNDFFVVTPDSTRIWTTDTTKGFGVRNIGASVKTSYMQLTPSNYFIGHESGSKITTGIYNSFIGYQAGKLTTLGSNNIFIGYRAGMNNTTGTHNAAVGNLAMYSNTTGRYNSALGLEALYNNISGWNNVAIGYRALYTNSNGDFSTAVGYQALLLNTSGTGNSALGYQTLGSNGAGAANTAIGYQALASNLSGNYNTAVGYTANIAASAYSNTTALGAQTTMNASNKVRIGNTTVTVIEGQVAYTFPSDGRFKKNVTEEVKGLDFIMKLRPIVYNFDTREFDEFLLQDLSDSLKRVMMSNNDYTESSSIRQSGFIAQEVEAAAKESGYDFNGIHKPSGDKDNYSVAYSLFTVPLVKAVQELNTKNEELQMVIEDIQKENEILKVKVQEIDILKAEIEKIKNSQSDNK